MSAKFNSFFPTTAAFQFIDGIKRPTHLYIPRRRFGLT